jgi:hypothetical protein
MVVQDLQASLLLEKLSDGGPTPELQVASSRDGGIGATEYLRPNEIAEYLLRGHFDNHEPGNSRRFEKCGHWIIQMFDHMAKNGDTERAVAKR